MVVRSLLIVGSGILFLAGCGEPVRTVTVQHFQPAAGRCAVFNPDPTGGPEAIVDRRDWPSSEAFHRSDEQTTYVEYVVDIQNRNPTRQEGPYRRFHSTRRGLGARP